MDGGAWLAAVHGVAKSRTRLSDFTFDFHFHALEKEMATHSSVLAWRIPGMGDPGGLPSMGSHRVGHDWSDLAAAAASKDFQALPLDRTQVPSLIKELLIRSHKLHIEAKKKKKARRPKVNGFTIYPLFLFFWLIHPQIYLLHSSYGHIWLISESLVP